LSKRCAFRKIIFEVNRTLEFKEFLGRIELMIVKGSAIFCCNDLVIAMPDKSSNYTSKGAMLDKPRSSMMGVVKPPVCLRQA